MQNIYSTLNYKAFKLISDYIANKHFSSKQLLQRFLYIYPKIKMKNNDDNNSNKRIKKTVHLEVSGIDVFQCHVFLSSPILEKNVFSKHLHEWSKGCTKNFSPNLLSSNNNTCYIYVYMLVPCNICLLFVVFLFALQLLGVAFLHQKRAPKLEYVNTDCALKYHMLME